MHVCVVGKGCVGGRGAMEGGGGANKRTVKLTRHLTLSSVTQVGGMHASSVNYGIGMCLYDSFAFTKTKLMKLGGEGSKK